MGGGFGGFFGGGEPAKEVETETAPTGFETLPDFGQEAFRQAFEQGTGFAGTADAFAPASLLPQQQAALETLGAGLLPTSAQQFATGLSTFGDPFEEQVVQSAIRDLTRSTQGQLSDIGTLASGSGAFGGQRQALLESEALRNLGLNIGDVSGRLRSQGFQSAAERTLGDINRQQRTAAQLIPLGETGRNVLTQQQQAPTASAQFLANLARGLPVGGGTTTTETVGTAQGPSDADQLGQALQIAATGAALFSDARLKDNISLVGENNGFNVYEFNYKSSPTKRYRGVMAQEVKKTNPDAVSTIDGFLAVDYNKIGMTMERV